MKYIVNAVTVLTVHLLKQRKSSKSALMKIII